MKKRKRIVSINFDEFFNKLIFLFLFALVATGFEKFILIILYFLTDLDSNPATWGIISKVTKLLAGSTAVLGFFYVYRNKIIVWSED